MKVLPCNNLADENISSDEHLDAVTDVIEHKEERFV